jgi:putative Mn2+ efflux pump MntP
LDVTTLLIAGGLAMDAFSVAVGHGLTQGEVHATRAMRIGLFFGAFQAGMPIVGWVVGTRVVDVISSVDHWIAFGLLSIIGARMIVDARSDGADRLLKSMRLTMLLMLSVATSIDALAVGLSLSLLQLPIAPTAIATGVITFTLSVLGVYLGSRFGQRLQHRVEIVGGLILIGIGLKILVEHLGSAG